MKSKNLKITFLFLALLLAGFTMHAQATAKVIAVVNKADWCHVCQQNGNKMMKEVAPVFENSNILIVMNDLTNETTTKKSKQVLKEHKVYAAVKDETATGMVFLVSKETGKITGKISVAEPAAAIIAALKNAPMKDGM